MTFFCPNLWLYFCICWRRCFREQLFQIRWPLESDKFHLSSLICCYQRRLSDHADRCSPVFRSLFKGQTTQTESYTIDCCLMTNDKLRLALFVLFMSVLYCRFGSIQFKCNPALSVYFLFFLPPHPFLCGNLCERWVPCAVCTGAQCQTVPGLIIRHVICPLNHRYMAFSWQSIHWWPYWRKGNWHLSPLCCLSCKQNKQLITWWWQ